MNKSNLATLLVLGIFVGAAIVLMFFEKTSSARAFTEADSSAAMENDILWTPNGVTENTSPLQGEEDSEASASIPEAPAGETEAPTAETEAPTAETEVPAGEAEVPTGQTEGPPAEPEAPTTENITMEQDVGISMDDALFIGDSRTVGLMEYAGIDGADYFCTVGMSVYNIHEGPVSVPHVGKVTLMQLLSSKSYGKIYIMLGINEVGYRFSSTVEKYSGLIDFIKGKQPDAVIFIQANLHVTKRRSDWDKVVNNTAINELNGELEKLADGKSKFYLDANILFDDKEGGLSPDKTGDSTHLYAKYYSEWSEWIIRQTASQIGEG